MVNRLAQSVIFSDNWALLRNTHSSPSGGGPVEVDGVTELFEASDEAAFSGRAITLIKIGGPEIDEWAVVLE